MDSNNFVTNLIVFTIDQSQFEAILCRVDGENTRPALSVQAVNAVASHTGRIDGQVQCPYDAMITTGTKLMCNIYFKMQMVYSEILYFTVLINSSALFKHFQETG